MIHNKLEISNFCCALQFSRTNVWFYFLRVQSLKHNTSYRFVQYKGFCLFRTIEKKTLYTKIVSDWTFLFLFLFSPKCSIAFELSMIFYNCNNYCHKTMPIAFTEKICISQSQFLNNKEKASPACRFEYYWQNDTHSEMCHTFRQSKWIFIRSHAGFDCMRDQTTQFCSAITFTLLLQWRERH